eukprot:6261147-Pyramimonas_sp.AAC.1
MGSMRMRTALAISLLSASITSSGRTSGGSQKPSPPGAAPEGFLGRKNNKMWLKSSISFAPTPSGPTSPRKRATPNR